MDVVTDWGVVSSELRITVIFMFLNRTMNPWHCAVDSYQRVHQWWPRHCRSVTADTILPTLDSLHSPAFFVCLTAYRVSGRTGDICLITMALTTTL